MYFTQLSLFQALNKVMSPIFTGTLASQRPLFSANQITPRGICMCATPVAHIDLADNPSPASTTSSLTNPPLVSTQKPASSSEASANDDEAGAGDPFWLPSKDDGDEDEDDQLCEVIDVEHGDTASTTAAKAGEEWFLSSFCPREQAVRSPGTTCCTLTSRSPKLKGGQQSLTALVVSGSQRRSRHSEKNGSPTMLLS